MKMEEWQKAILPKLRKIDFVKANSMLQKVTLLAYFFWDDERIETYFYAIECAFLCAFKCYGLMPAILVVNKTTKTIYEFCEKYNIELQVDPSLKGGIPAMSVDCVKNLHGRFKTEYVLIIQTDGMPVNAGLEKFLGKYDYYGAPWPGHCHYKDWFPYPRYGVGNGGFSLRSKRICECASKSYNIVWKYLPYSWLVEDDVFYCKTMPFISRYWKRTFKFPSLQEAATFAIEAICKYSDTENPPMGFHSSYGFEQYVKRFGLPMAELLNHR
jgi:hypothetical protein